MGSRQFHILLFINVTTRKVVCGGVCEKPDGTWVKNAVHSMLRYEFEHMKYLIMDI